MLVERLRRRLHQPQVVVIHADILDVHAREALAEISAAPPYGIVGNLALCDYRTALPQVPQRGTGSLARLAPGHGAAGSGGTGARPRPGSGPCSASRCSTTPSPSCCSRWNRKRSNPPPRVRSAVLLIRRRPAPTVEAPSEARFFEVARAGFRAPRKQLHNALEQGVWLAEGEAKRLSGGMQNRSGPPCRDADARGVGRASHGGASATAQHPRPRMLRSEQQSRRDETVAIACSRPRQAQSDAGGLRHARRWLP